ncbi:hypothetical protein E2C01_085955 [Portunus trituberculatus]|uniref:Uncharacterized protein n=1 Tax=Portunus trituberculatus TaxID=210409 RepID=A0A5B7IZH7_PORTR|nr:hypothetical protein [Portunus trituberculatus]
MELGSEEQSAAVRGTLHARIRKNGHELEISRPCYRPLISATPSLSMTTPPTTPLQPTISPTPSSTFLFCPVVLSSIHEARRRSEERQAY